MTRGERLFNPGCIRHSSINWLGQAQTQTDPDFVQFDAAKWGIRAMARILKNYEREGATTIRDAIDRWSPPTENNTSAYVQAVCQDCSLTPDQTIDLSAILPQVVTAIIRHENGEVIYNSSDIAYAVSMA